MMVFRYPAIRSPLRLRRFPLACSVVCLGVLCSALLPGCCALKGKNTASSIAEAPVFPPMPAEATEIGAEEAMEILRSDTPFSPIYTTPPESRLVIKDRAIEEAPSTAADPVGEPVIRGADPADTIPKLGPELGDPALLPRFDEETLPLPKDSPGLEAGAGEKTAKSASPPNANVGQSATNKALLDELQRKIVSLEGELIGRDAIIRKLEANRETANPTGQEPPMIAPRINIPGVEVRQDVGTVRIAVPDALLFQANAPFKLHKSGEDVLRRVISEIRVNYPQKTILIEGHTDNITLNPQNPTYLIEISTFKATVVAQHLATNLDIDTDFLEAAGIGAREPLDSNDTEEGRARNRRTEFVLRANR